MVDTYGYYCPEGPELCAMCSLTHIRDLGSFKPFVERMNSHYYHVLLTPPSNFLREKRGDLRR